MAGRFNRGITSRLLAVGLLLALTAPMALAAPVPSQPASAVETDLDGAAIAAERELLGGKLMDFGLTQQAAADRVDLLSDQEIHVIVQDLDAIQAGGALGDQQWDTVTVLLLLILVAILAD